MIRLVKYFTIITFLINTAVVAVVYLSPTPSLIDYSVLYGVAFAAFSVVLLAIVASKIWRRWNNRPKLITAAVLLTVNLIVGIIYYFIWNFSIGTILVKITNNTGQDVTNTGIYGCSEQTWGILKSGETKTVRFPGNVDCMFIVTYKLNTVVRHEALPRKNLTTNFYQLGTNPDINISD